MMARAEPPIVEAMFGQVESRTFVPPTARRGASRM
jgi:hypothetical protein